MESVGVNRNIYQIIAKVLLSF